MDETADGDAQLNKLILSMNANWWKRDGVCRVFSRQFSRHVVGLHLLMQVDGKPEQDLFTGCVVTYRGVTGWATAGHVIDELERYLSSPKVRIMSSNWMDGCEIPGAEGVPAVGLSELPRFSFEPHGIDFGWMPFGAASQMLIANEKLAPIDEVAWYKHEEAAPEGYYLVGFPLEWWHPFSAIVADKRRATAQLHAQLAVVPLEMIEPEPPLLKGDFWDHPTCYYARKLPLTSNHGKVLADIQGTSGGPIFSIERTESGRMKYRLYGIQSAWAPDRETLRFERVSVIDEVLRALTSAIT
jgi:hypothetical protein